MNLYDAVADIKNGVPYDVVIDGLLEAKKRIGPDGWREILTWLRKWVGDAKKRGDHPAESTSAWLRILSKAASEFQTTNRDIAHFLLAFKILDKLKAGNLTDSDIHVVYTRLVDTQKKSDKSPVSSEAELTAYFKKEDARKRKEADKRNAADQSTERMVIPRGPTQEFKIKRKKKKKKKKKKSRRRFRRPDA